MRWKKKYILNPVLNNYFVSFWELMFGNLQWVSDLILIITEFLKWPFKANKWKNSIKLIVLLSNLIPRNLVFFMIFISFLKNGVGLCNFFFILFNIEWQKVQNLCNVQGQFLPLQKWYIGKFVKFLKIIKNMAYLWLTHFSFLPNFRRLKN
jgi:hypothetical protein